MTRTELTALSLAWAGMACWLVCFWWMHRLSGRQEAMLKELHEVASRIEKLSEQEHELLREVHPVVGQIKDSMQEVVEAVGPEGRSQ